ncbi:MAG: hypothetical protein AAF587_00845 [Bacteroidota bacterium]
MQIRRQDFTTGIPQLIGHTVSFFKVSGDSKADRFDPAVFWLQTHETNYWYRFSLHAFALHWDTYSESEAQQLMDKDLEQRGQQQVKNLKKDFRLDKERIVSIKMDQHLIDEQRYGQLRILFESGKKIVVQDFDEENITKLTLENS